MTKVTLKLSRTNENGLKYTGDADKYLNLPIVIDDKVIGVVIEIISDSGDYIEVEGFLYRAGVNLMNIEEELRFSNNLKRHNNNPSNAYDLFSAKKAMEYLNIYVEEFFFLTRDKTDGNYYERKELRRLIHLLNDKIGE